MGRFFYVYFFGCVSARPHGGYLNQCTVGAWGPWAWRAVSSVSMAWGFIGRRSSRDEVLTSVIVGIRILGLAVIKQSEIR